jgi:hypothetical protein
MFHGYHLKEMMYTVAYGGGDGNRTKKKCENPGVN